MNRLLLREYISAYEQRFDEISRMELYKWGAVKQFQDYWNLDSDDFPGMLALALSKTANLLDAGNYWPKRMILKIAEDRPQLTRELFAALFDENEDLLERVSSFQKGADELTSRLLPGKKSYQDPRAVLVYLNLMYPDTYFLYKFGMFKSFCEKVGCDFVPKAGELSNIIKYLEICSMVRDEIRTNNHLLKLHKERIGDTEYYDAESNILTQDFIYAVTKYLTVGLESVQVFRPSLVLTDAVIEPARKTYQFRGSYVDYVARQKRNTSIGRHGEEYVIQYELEHCPPENKNRIVHASMDEGDGLGYDILSIDDTGEEKYIEVKTTTGGLEKSFFITGVELERSKKEGKKYYLYRLYNFNEKNMTSDLLILRGDLGKYCINPVEYEVIPEVIGTTSDDRRPKNKQETK